MLENFPYDKGPQKAQSVRFSEHPTPTLPNKSSQTWIPEGPKGWLRQGDRHKLEDSLDYTVKPCLRKRKGLVWCCAPVIPTLGRLWQEDCHKLGATPS